MGTMARRPRCVGIAWIGELDDAVLAREILVRGACVRASVGLKERDATDSGARGLRR